MGEHARGGRSERDRIVSAIERRRFGQTDVPMIGQGTWQMEGDDRASCVRALRAGLDLGLTHVDTAELYGRGEVETVVAEAFSEALGRTVASPEDHFFELGGHSLLATRVVSALRTSIGVEVPLRVVFEAPRVRDLGRAILELRADEPGGLPPIRRRAWRRCSAACWRWRPTRRNGPTKSRSRSRASRSSPARGSTRPRRSSSFC